MLRWFTMSKENIQRMYIIREYDPRAVTRHPLNWASWLALNLCISHSIKPDPHRHYYSRQQYKTVLSPLANSKLAFDTRFVFLVISSAILFGILISHLNNPALPSTPPPAHSKLETTSGKDGWRWQFPQCCLLCQLVKSLLNIKSSSVGSIVAGQG